MVVESLGRCRRARSKVILMTRLSRQAQAGVSSPR
jgi:hypothetical protein